MAIQPTYHWQFNEREGSVTKDINGVEAKLVGCSLQLHGRIGNAIQLNGKNSALYLGQEAGQFGTGDFTIAFGMAVLNRNDQDNLDIIGTRSSKSHGNWVSLLLINKKQLYFEVDEDAKGTNYFTLKTENIINDHAWHHIALVRQKLMLRIYVDGEEVASGEAPGIANINNDADMKVGDWLRDTPTARYEDLRIYHTALNSLQIQNLVPPANRLLREGEIELIATDDASIILNQDVDDLSRYSTEFQKLRFGPNTGATLYRSPDFTGASQKLYANIPDTRSTRIDSFPRSIRVWSSIGEPFTGKWVIKAPNGEYLSWNGNFLTTSTTITSKEFFTLHYNPHKNQPQFIPVTDEAGLHFPFALLADYSEIQKDAFSIINVAHDAWLHLSPNKTFGWTKTHEDRTVFFPAVKLADNEGQVGELTSGDVALYEHGTYKGRVWILSDSDPLSAGNYPNFKVIPGLNDTLSSIRLGADTGATLFVNVNNEAKESNREREIEDIVDNVPNMDETQIGHDKVSSLQIFRTVAQDTIFTSVTSKLSEDYRMVDGELEQFSAYRTILHVSPDVSEVEISATDLTSIEVEGTTYEIDEVRTVTLSPNVLRQIMVTSEADSISTPGLKFRTSDMAENERVIIFPDQEAHKQIADLEEDELWNATDAQGNNIIDQEAFTRSDIASVQNTIKRTMASVVYKEVSADSGESAVPDTVATNTRGLVRNLSLKRNISSAEVSNPWVLDFSSSAPTSGRIGGALLRADGGGGVGGVGGIHEQPLTQSQFEQMLADAQPTDTVKPIQTDGPVVGVNQFASARAFGRIGSAIKNAVKKASRVVIGFVKDVMKILVDGVEFLLDTIEKVAAFVEAVLEKVVKSLKQFIEYLRFLFAWDDILDTQKHLVRIINGAFDSASSLVESAKGAVTNFVNDVQDNIEDGVNNLIRSLGVDPSEVEESDGFELPEAAQWFLNKLFGNSGNSGSESNSNAPEVVDPDSPFQQALQHLLEALEGVVGIGVTVFDGLIETVESLITNPRRPELALAQILVTVRDVGIQILDVAEDIILAFLNLVITAIDLLKDILNAEIPIPLISHLFELIGGGKLTILNLTTLLLAIPVTVVAKLILGEKPFKDASLPEFPQPITETEFNVVARAAVATTEETAEETPFIPSKEQLQKIKDFGVVALVADAFNGLFGMILDAFPEISDDDQGKFFGNVEIISLILSGFSWLASFPASPEEPGGYPYHLAKRKNRPSNDQEYWQRIVWGWRTGMLGIDILYMAGGRFLGGKKQRLKRADKYTAGLITALAVIDIGLTSRYLSTLDKEDKKGREIANEIIGLLPNLFCLLRQPENTKVLTVTVPMQVAIDGMALAVNTGLGVRILKDSLKISVETA